MTYEDKRDWREYNERLVKRGWFYLSTDFVKNWDYELKKMNKSKNGVPIAIQRRSYSFVVWRTPSSICHIASLKDFCRHWAESVLEFKKYGYDSWKIVHGYGRRWADESVFSAIKGIFGETVRATSVEGMYCEVRRMLTFYTIILGV